MGSSLDVFEAVSNVARSWIWSLFFCVAGEGESWWRRVLCRGASGGGTSYEGRPRKGRHPPGLILRNAEVVFSHFSYFRVILMFV